MINLPAEIVAKSFRECPGTVRTIHSGVVFKALLADVLHEGPEPRNRHDRFGREGIKRIVGENTITYVGADGSRQIIPADTG